MGEREKIIFADDFIEVTPDGFQSLFNRIEEAGHEIVGISANVEGVRKVTQDLKDKEITPTLAILDGNMPLKGDGAKAAEIVRKEFPEIKVVAYSTQPQTFGDKCWSKSNSFENIVNFISDNI